MSQMTHLATMVNIMVRMPKTYAIKMRYYFYIE